MVASTSRGSGTSDDETKAAIYEGVNVSQMCILFRLDSRTVARKLFEGRVKPCGKRHHADIYHVADVAPHLVKPIFDVETYIRKMDHRELPKTLTKEFWAGQRSRQDFEEKAGLLWRTEKIVEAVGDLFKLVKMSVLLMLDAVERQTELTERQRQIIKELSHGMLNDLRGRITDKFKVPEAPKYVERQEAGHDEEI